MQDDAWWRDKLGLLLRDPAPVVSVTFGGHSGTHDPAQRTAEEHLRLPREATAAT